MELLYTLCKHARCTLRTPDLCARTRDIHRSLSVFFYKRIQGRDDFLCLGLLDDPSSALECFAITERFCAHLEHDVRGCPDFLSYIQSLLYALLWLTRAAPLAFFLKFVVSLSPRTTEFESVTPLHFLSSTQRSLCCFQQLLNPISSSNYLQRKSLEEAEVTMISPDSITTTFGIQKAGSVS